MLEETSEAGDAKQATAPEAPRATPPERAEVRARPRRAARARGKRKKRRTGSAAAKSAQGPASRAKRPFPSTPFQDALALGEAIQKFAGGGQIRRLTLFDKLGKSPESSVSRQLIIDSARYGITSGGQKAEHIALTPDGEAATSPDSSPAVKLRARFALAIESVPVFLQIYDQYKSSRLAAHDVMQDFVREKGVPDQHAAECVDAFVVNTKFLDLIKMSSGVERLLPIEHIIEELPAGGDGSAPLVGEEFNAPESSATLDVQPEWSTVCFYISPIGEAGTEERKHSDFFLVHLVEPALKESGLTLVRADSIGKPGMITAQVIEYITKSGLAIADLSFHNPNVFYELSLRHACRLPTVHLIRQADRIPFDLDQFRTIPIDTSNVYELYPRMETHISEISSQIRKALSDPDDVENPITVFCPGLKVSIPR